MSLVARLTQFPSNGGNYKAHLQTYGPLPKGKPKQWLSVVEASGLRGRGGGWFPTAQKMQTVIRNAKHRHRRPVVVCNAMEGEPDSVGDAWIVGAHPQLVLDGLFAAARIVGARKAYIALHQGAPELDLLRKSLKQRPSGKVDIEIVAAPPRYVASEESALTHFISTGNALPVFGARPFEHGVKGRPTLVNNAETMAQLALILRRGAAWFREVGTEAAPGTTLVSVGGDVISPKVVEVAIGTPIRELVAAAGGVHGDLLGVRVAGFGGAWAGPDALDLSWDPDALREVGLRAGAGILSVISNQHCPIVETARTMQYLAGESAGQCGVCSLGLSATANDFSSLATMQSNPAGVQNTVVQLAEIPRRGGCALPDGAAGMAQSAMAVFPAEVEAHLHGRCVAGLPYPATPWQYIPSVRPHPVVAPRRHFA